MKAHDTRHQLEMRAATALKAALAEVSTIKVREIRHEPSQAGRDSRLVICVDLFGQRHTLTCGIDSDGEPQQVRSLLEGLRTVGTQRDPEAMPIIFAPSLSPESQALCKESRAGFVDLEGNARLALGEVFIVKHTLPQYNPHRSTMAVSRRPVQQEKSPVSAASTQKSAAQQGVA
jgi:hypothetical protein